MRLKVDTGHNGLGYQRDVDAGELLAGWQPVPFQGADQTGSPSPFDFASGQRAPRAHPFPVLDGTGTPGVSVRLPASPSCSLRAPEPEEPRADDVVAGESYVVFGVGVPIPPNPADCSGDGCVDSADLAILLAAWASMTSDLNGDMVTGSGDLAILLAAWGSGCS